MCSCVPPRSLRLCCALVQVALGGGDCPVRHPARTQRALGGAIIQQELERVLLEAPLHRGELDSEANSDGVAQAAALELGAHLAHGYELAVGRGLEPLQACPRAGHVLRQMEEFVQQALGQAGQSLQELQRKSAHRCSVSFALA